MDMDILKALLSFRALSQETRLKALKLLVAHGKSGVAAGILSEQLGIPHNTLSFHLSHLSDAGLVLSKKRGRQMIYFVNFETITNLMGFLAENCCAAEGTTCHDMDKLTQGTTC